jgi:hypothetical protein
MTRGSAVLVASKSQIVDPSGAPTSKEPESLAQAKNDGPPTIGDAVMTRASDPSARATTRSFAEPDAPVFARTNAMRVPSGEKAGSESSSGPTTVVVTTPVAGSTV